MFLFCEALFSLVCPSSLNIFYKSFVSCVLTIFCHSVPCFSLPAWCFWMNRIFTLVRLVKFCLLCLRLFVYYLRNLSLYQGLEDMLLYYLIEPLCIFLSILLFNQLRLYFCAWWKGHILFSSIFLSPSFPSFLTTNFQYGNLISPIPLFKRFSFLLCHLCHKST